MGGETTEMSETTTDVLVEAAHWDAVSMFRTGQAAQDHLRGRQAQRARRRPDDHRGRGRPGGRAADDVRRRHRRPGRDRRRRAARAAAGSPSAYDLPGPGDRHGHRRGDDGRRPRGRRLRGWSEARHDADRDAAAVAARPHRPLRPGRGGRPDRRLRPGAVGAAARGGRARPDPRAAAAPPGRPHAGRRRLRRGDQLPVRRRLPRSTRWACPPTTCCVAPSGWPTRCPARSRRTPRRCCRGCCRQPPATSAGAPREWRCSRPARSPSRSTAARRRSSASTGGPSDGRAGEAPRGASRSSRCTSPRCSPASASVPAGGARAGRPAGPTRSALVRAARHRARRRGRGGGGQPDALAPGPVRRAPGRRASSSATRASCTRACARRSGCRRAPRSAEIDLDVLHAARARRGARSRRSRRTRSPRRTSHSWSTTDVTAAEVEAALREGAGTLLESIRLFDVYTGEQVPAGPQVARLRAAVPRARPDADRGGDGGRPRRGGRARRRADRCGPAELTARTARGSTVLDDVTLGRPARFRASAPTRCCAAWRTPGHGGCREEALIERSGATTSLPTRSRHCRSSSRGRGRPPAPR